MITESDEMKNYHTLIETCALSAQHLVASLLLVILLMLLS